MATQIKSITWYALTAILIFCVFCGISQASYLYTFQAFDSSGNYYDVPQLNVTMEVYNGEGIVHFKFRNLSSQESSVARIYFDDSLLLEGPTITATQGEVIFNPMVFPGPEDLPGGENIGFQATSGFTIGSTAPPPSHGINEYPSPDDEWLEVAFTLSDPESDWTDVQYELDNEILRVGIHIISLDPPVGGQNSISMVNTPEPTTICLLALGGFALRRKRRV